jgi:hypothetical protein
VAAIKTLIERDGVPIASGREKPTWSEDLRLRVQSRDGTCLVPGCAVPATSCEVHHIHLRTLEGDLRFVAADGRPMGTVTGGHWKRPKNSPGP